VLSETNVPCAWAHWHSPSKWRRPY